MKKGLLSILAGALLVVGCQDYDTQFDKLEADIAALATTISGLAQVQSELTSLSGTVASLSSTVNGLGDQIDTAVADGLSEIQKDITAIEAAVADVASSEEVTTLSDAVAASQEDLDKLLANSSVFTGPVTVNSVATLDAFHAMGSALAIVNGSVDIDVSTSMDIVKVQELVDQILTVTGDLEYTAAASTIAEVSFNNLSGVQTLTLEQPGGYVFQGLVSAQKIYLSDKYKSSVDIIDFRALTDVASFGTDAYTGGAITFDKAKEIHLTSLAYYTPGTLSLTGKKGGVIDITALDDVNASGDQSALNLSISGPETVAITKLDGKGGSLTFTDVENVTVTDYDGTITVMDGVENFTSNNVVAFGTASTWADIVTADVTGVVDPNFIASTLVPKDYGPAVAFGSLSDLEELTLAGTLTSVSITGNTNLITTIISADVTGAAGIVITGNTDMETLTLTGSKSPLVNSSTNNSLTSLTIDTTIQKSSAKLATLDGTITVVDNEDLESLVISSKDVSILTITGNDALTSIDGTGLTTLGAGGTTAAPIAPAVNINDNDLSATLATDKTNATSCTDCDNLEANDLGSFTTDSKMATLKTYLALVAADTTASAAVYFDTVESTVDNTGAETTAETTGAVDATAILVMTPATAEVVTGAGAAIKAKRAWLIDVSVAGTLSLTYDSVHILNKNDGNGFGAVTYSTGTTDSNQSLTLTELKNTLSTTRATDLGLTLDVVKAGATLPGFAINPNISSTSNGEGYTNVQATALEAMNGGTLVAESFLTTNDKVTLTLGDQSITVTSTTNSISGAVASAEIVDRLVAVWNAKYGAYGTSSSLSIWGDLSEATSMTIAATSLKSSTAGSRGLDHSVSITFTPASSAVVSASTSAARTQTMLSYTIATLQDSTDNGATSKDLVLTLESGTGNAASAVMSHSGGDAVIELITTERTLSNDGAGTNTATAQHIWPREPRSDARAAEGASEGVVTTAGVTAVAKTRVHWLGS